MLQKHKALTAEQAAPLRLRAHRENLAALEGDGEQVLRYWKSMAEQDRREARLALNAARALAAAEDCGGAGRLIEDFLDHEWDSTLVAVYGQCRGGDVVARIAHAEKWLADHPRDGAHGLVDAVLPAPRLALPAQSRQPAFGLTREPRPL